MRDPVFRTLPGTLKDLLRRFHIHSWSSGLLSHLPLSWHREPDLEKMRLECPLHQERRKAFWVGQSADGGASWLGVQRGRRGGGAGVGGDVAGCKGDYLTGSTGGGGLDLGVRLLGTCFKLFLYCKDVFISSSNTHDDLGKTKHSESTALSSSLVELQRIVVVVVVVVVSVAVAVILVKTMEVVAYKYSTLNGLAALELIPMVVDLALFGTFARNLYL